MKLFNFILLILWREIRKQLTKSLKTRISANAVISSLLAILPSYEYRLFRVRPVMTALISLQILNFYMLNRKFSIKGKIYGLTVKIKRD